MPFSKLGATNNSADKNWLEALASIVRAPPGIFPFPCNFKGKLYRPSCSIEIPNSSKALITGPSGRS